MTTPATTGRTFVLYALAIASLLLDIHYGGTLFALAGFTGSLLLTTHLLYRAAGAMAFSPTAARLRTVAALGPSENRRITA